MTRAVHQFLPTWEPGAIGGHARELRDLVLAEGLASEVFTYEARPGLPDVARPYQEYGRSVPANPDDVLVYHLAVGSEVADFLIGRPETIVVNYHNITPAEIFEPWDPVVGENLEWGRVQLARLARRTRLALADSRFNEAELRTAGYRATDVAPIMADLAVASVPELDRRLAQPPAAADEGGPTGPPGARWLFVSRLAPNKAQHEVVKAFAVFRRVYDPNATLALVGGEGSPAYARALRRLIRSLGLDPAVEVAGSVDAATLAGHYSSADVFVCLSSHEGFCVPLLEAMHHGLPVVARAAAAVPETAHDAALLVDRPGAAIVAGVAQRVLTDVGLRERLVASGRVRAAEHSLDRTRERFRRALTPVLNGAGG